MNSRYQNFSEFWPFYLSQHQNPDCRRLHVVGSFLGSMCLALAFFFGTTWILVGLSIGYACAWIGHFVFEKNRPATFQYPLWSFVADYKMSYEILTGRLPIQSSVRKDQT